MPKSTFYNIDEEKRERIIEVIIEEFSENTYDTASINQIVKNADIAKGSFYQYFEDKLDIYKLAMGIAQSERNKYIKRVNEDNRYIDEFRIMRELCIAIIKFEIDRPACSSIVNKFHKNTDLEIKKEVLKDIEVASTYEFKSILEDGINSGRIYYNVDVELMTFILENISRDIKEYFNMKRKKDKYISYEGFVDTAIDLVENGIKSKRKSRINDIL